ncbi:hypothetical protein Vadar_032114 [Vaccinium darrowii]|uniref:Uncharacterized protein n=1 Tax=Vaccinium darrowii TaxID=229202 RepID=A0ACB7ZFK2_9ERIC|nr:hypothetical protein Vadar_032114 [Vaccinium darrowii]
MDALEQWLDTLYDGDGIEIENTINLTRSKLVELFDHYKTLAVGVDRTTPVETMSPAASATRGGAMSLLKVRRMSYNSSSASGIESELTSYLNQPIVEYDEEDESFDQLDKVEIGRRWNNLPKEEKRKFEDKATSANELLSSLKALDSRPRKRRRKIQTRIALKQITEIVSKFSEEQRTAVKAVGLGGILDLSCTKLNHGICEWLVNNFDPDTHSLTVHGRKFVITESHVEECLGINGQGNIVSMNSVEGFHEMCIDLGVSKGFVEIKGLLVYLLKTTVADEGFKRKFALYILGSFLCPTTKPAVHESLINLVSDVGAMENVNWARITLEFRCNAIRGQRTHSRVHANGCLFLLSVFYLERVSPTGFHQIPRTDRPLLFWGDREIKDVLRRFKKIGGYMKQGVGVIFTKEEVSMDDGEDKTNGKASNSHQIPNVVLHDMKSTLDKVADLLERQTTVFERYFGYQVANNQYRMANNHDEVANKKQASNNKHSVQLNQNSRSPHTGERMSTPRTFRTHDGVVDHTKGQGDGTKDNKYGPIFPQNEYDGFQSIPHGTSQGKTHTPKRNYENGVDDVPFSPSPSPLSGFKPSVGLSRGRKRKITKPTLRCSLRLSNYEPPDLRPRAELKKGPLLSSPYTRDGRKNRKPGNKSGCAQSPIVVDDVKFDVNSPSPYV